MLARHPTPLVPLQQGKPGLAAGDGDRIVAAVRLDGSVAISVLDYSHTASAPDYARQGNSGCCARQRICRANPMGLNT